MRITGRVKELFKTSKGKYVAPAPIENLLNSDTNIEQTCVTGSGRSQPFALVLLSEQLRAELASGKADRGSVDAQLKALLTKVNAQIEEHEQLSFLVVVKDTWQIENGFLTPTMKVKRSTVEGAYAAEVDDWYERNQRVIWQG